MATTLPTLTRDDVAGSGIADGHFDSKNQSARAAINAGLTGLNGLISGTTQIALGQAAKTVTAATLGGNYGGKPVLVTLNTVDATLTSVLTAVWSGNDLVITGNAAATAAVTVSFLIDNRS